VLIHNFIPVLIIDISNRIGGVMVSVLALSVVDREFEPRSEQVYANSAIFLRYHVY
jgi:hypothetical protein